MRSKKAFYNIVSNLILQLVIIIYGFIVPKIIISKFGSNVNGLISSITQFLAYIALLESGFGPIVKATLYKPIAKKDKKTITNILKETERFFRLIAGIFIIYIIILTIIYPLFVNNEFGKMYTISLIIIISISTFVEYFFGMTYSLYLQAEQKTYITSLIQIITYIFSSIIIIILAKFNVSIQVIKLATGLIFIVRPLVQNMYVKKKYNINLRETNERYELKQKWDGLSQHIAAVVHGNTDITLLTIFGTLSEVSVYSVYYLVIKGIKQLIQSFSNGIEAIWGDMIAKNEHDNLNKKFNLYEIIYFMIGTTLFLCTMVLIVPFIKLYTKNINDTNYERPLFAISILLAEFIWNIRLPYLTLTYSAGHFKQTRKGAWVEAIVNIVISILLVRKLGIVGVAIGTLIAMIIRTMEIIYHSSRYILNRSLKVSIKKLKNILIVFILVVPMWFLVNNYLKITNCIKWICVSVVVLAYIILVVIIVNYLTFKKEFIEIINTLKNFLKRKSENEKILKKN